MTTAGRPIGAQEMLELWETGRTRHPVDRAVLLLTAAEDAPLTAATEDIDPLDARSIDALQRLSVGTRDAYLLRLHRATFGDRLDGRASCPACAETLEVTLTCSALLAAGDSPEAGAQLEVAEGGYRVAFRPPDSRDLASIAMLTDVGEARAMLLDRCVTSATGPAGVTTADALPETVLARISERMAEADPHAELLLDLACPDCGTEWQAQLDITTLLWARVSSHARRMLLEVDALARVYGWRESEILALSPTRRATYLELAVG